MSLLVAVAITNAIGRERAHSTSPLTPVANVECYPKRISICLRPTRTRTGANSYQLFKHIFLDLSQTKICHVTSSSMSLLTCCSSNYNILLLHETHDHLLRLNETLICDREGFSNRFVTIQDSIC